MLGPAAPLHALPPLATPSLSSDPRAPVVRTQAATFLDDMFAASDKLTAVAAALLAMLSLADRASGVKMVDNTDYQACKANSTCKDLCVVDRSTPLPSHLLPTCAAGAARVHMRVHPHSAPRLAAPRTRRSMASPTQAHPRSLHAPSCPATCHYATGKSHATETWTAG